MYFEGDKMWTLLILLTNIVSSFVDGCPNGCTCIPAQNPTAVDCKRRPFKEEMFLTIPSSASQLYLTNSNITYPLERWMFSRLRHLEYLYLDNFVGVEENANIIKTINDGVFHDLTKLEFLSLQGSHLTSISSDTFKGLVSLNRLFLQNNLLTTFPTSPFWNLNNLNQIMLQHNQIQNIDSHVYIGLNNIEDLNFTDNKLTRISNVNGLSTLERIHLSQNRLTGVSSTMFKDLTKLYEIEINDNPLTAIGQDALKTLQNLQVLKIKSTDLLCRCDYLDVSWNMIHNGYVAEVTCNHGNHQLSTLDNKQMTNEEVKNVGCESKSIWSNWGPPEECKNYISIKRRTCLGQFMIPQCNGSSINATICEPVFYANYSKAQGLIKFNNVKKRSSLLTPQELNREIVLFEEDFKEKLALELKYLIYNQYSFKNHEVYITSMRVKSVQPVLHVAYQIKMERTTAPIASVNPLAEDKTITFGYYEAETQRVWSTISDYDECNNDDPCHHEARCVISAYNFNFGCQCHKNLIGDGFHCRSRPKQSTSVIPKSISPALVIGCIIGAWVVFMICFFTARWFVKKKDPAYVDDDDEDDEKKKMEEVYGESDDNDGNEKNKKNNNKYEQDNRGSKVRYSSDSFDHPTTTSTNNINTNKTTTSGRGKEKMVKKKKRPHQNEGIALGKVNQAYGSVGDTESGMTFTAF